MTERADPDTAPVPRPGDADPDQGETPGGDPVPAPFGDPDVEQPPVEEDRPGARAASVPPATGVPADPLTGGTAGAPLTEATAPAVEAGPTIDAGSHTATSAPLGEPTPAWDGATTAQANAQTERPELLVAGAFAGGLVLALILKRLGR